VEDRTLLAAGFVASAVWLLGALSMSRLERGFMDGLGWDVWPSGLALGPWGWIQIVVFLAFAVALIAYAWTLVRIPLPRVSRWGSRILLVGAVISPLLAFRTDPPGHGTTWHGALHATGYLAMMLGILVSLMLVLPVAIRRAGPRQWAVAALALLLLPPAALMPEEAGAGQYLFFAVPMVLLSLESLLLWAPERVALRV
jgi:hypothetical protein